MGREPKWGACGALKWGQMAVGEGHEGYGDRGGHGATGSMGLWVHGAQRPPSPHSCSAGPLGAAECGGGERGAAAALRAPLPIRGLGVPRCAAPHGREHPHRELRHGQGQRSRGHGCQGSGGSPGHGVRGGQWATGVRGWGVVGSWGHGVMGVAGVRGGHGVMRAGVRGGHGVRRGSGGPGGQGSGCGGVPGSCCQRSEVTGSRGHLWPDPQLYNALPALLDPLPGPHRRFFRNTACVRSFLDGVIAGGGGEKSGETSRDFVSAFRRKMEEEEEVGGEGRGRGRERGGRG